MNICSAWGNYPKIECNRFRFTTEDNLREIISSNSYLIPFGNGRSYGDSALSRNIIENIYRDYFLDFDESSGLLHIEAGVLLSEILEHFVPRGWFLKVTPGTKLITVGGAIASDVHGKNHHIEGCFSESVEEFRLMRADGEIVTCSQDKTPDLWRATCGGQGLTGVILDAKIYLKKINSINIEQTTIKTANLKETFEAFEEYSSYPYSVAWIDCLAKNDSIGRSLLMVGRFRDDGELEYKPKSVKTIPFDFPSFTLNSWSVKAFNYLYYNRVKEKVSHQRVSIDSFFYPLDSINHWNRIYGSRGFTQYQFILPKESSYAGLQEILTEISASNRGSFLAVLKLYGKSNGNWLSFPIEGYSLALDFKIENGLFALLDRLDKIVVKYGGRIYLTKDSRVSKEIFEQGYRDIEKFREFRRESGADMKFNSIQSQRVEI